jgi:ribonucleoside-diphosphate reductase alpha chain
MSAFSQTEGVETVHSTLKAKDAGSDYISLNAALETWGTAEDGTQYVQYDKDREAARQFFLNHVNPNMYNALDLEEKIRFLVDEDYYEREFLEKYDFAFVKQLFKDVYAEKFRFATFVGAYKFYNSYALKTFDGKRYLERFEDRVAATALFIADGDEAFATKLAKEMISGRFQPATPTFLNAGKKQRGELVSCFLLNVEDNLNSIMRAVNSAAQLSKRGGGVALNLTNVRGKGDPIKKIENQASGVIPVMKLLEDTFSYANQLGARQGAGAVYLNATLISWTSLTPSVRTLTRRFVSRPSHSESSFQTSPLSLLVKARKCTSSPHTICSRYMVRKWPG